jgi:hypothetical protein
MGRWKRMLVHVAWSGLVISGFPGVILPVAAQQAAVPAGDNSATAPKSPLVARAEEPPPLAELPDSPGTVAAKSGELVQQQSGTPQSQAQPSGQRPVGTAAAEAPDASGIAASQPAGIAMAPAKQRRTRTLILRMGAIIGAGVAVGSVVALTEATSSKPPGAH